LAARAFPILVLLWSSKFIALSAEEEYDSRESMSADLFGIGSVLVSLVLVVGIAILVLRIKDKTLPFLFSKRIREREKLRLDRFRNPQADAVERMLGKQLPERLLAMYEDMETVQQEHFHVTPIGKKKRWLGGHDVTRFVPLRPEFILIWPDGQDPGTGFCFARNAKYFFYWIEASPERTKDEPVYMISCYASVWSKDKIAESLDEFLSWQRVPSCWMRWVSS
jgi:hypothetical protein